MVEYEQSLVQENSVSIERVLFVYIRLVHELAWSRSNGIR